MATIYRFIIEGGGRGKGGGAPLKPKSGIGKGTAKKGKWVSYLDSSKSGVEANRRMRAINPIINKMTGGMWEKGTRLGRAGFGLVQRNTETNATRLSPTAVSIIIALILTTIVKQHQMLIARANEINQRNYKSIENGITQVRNIQDVSQNIISGKINYNQNK